MYVALLGVVTLAVATGARPAPARAADVAVIVQAGHGTSSARDAVLRAGGTITRELPLIGGVAARLPSGSLALLRHSATVRSVVIDRPLHAESVGDCAALDPTCYDALPPYTKWEDAVGLSKVPNKYKGDLVTVAVLDTGVTPGPDLGTRLLARIDLTADRDGLDHLGHGTHIAGLIAGDGTQSFESYEGAASEANIVSVKVAGWDGATDVSTVIAGLQWVVAHKEQYGIRVLNLSFGTDSRQSAAVDPLDAAVERVWDAGIFVAVSAGNAGGAGTVTKPGDDPYVLTVGAADVGDPATLADDAVAPFSSYGPSVDGEVKPDLVAPGISLVSLRALGSTADAFRPAARIGEFYFKGTGTSQAAAIVSGIAARMIEADPTLTPARLKAVLLATARPLPGLAGSGAGLIDAYAAVRSVAPKTAVAIAPFTPGRARSTGLGLLDESRGTLKAVTDLDGDGIPETLSGEVDALGLPWVATAFASTPWTGQTWSASPWAPRVSVDAGLVPAPVPTGPLLSPVAWEARFWGASTWEAAGWDARFWGARFWGARFWGSDFWG